MDNYLARIKPFDAQKGHVLRGYTCTTLGMAFEEGKTYPVTEATAEVLRKVHSRVGDESSPLAFDVGPADEIKAMLTREARARLGLTAEVMEILREDPAIGSLSRQDVTFEAPASAASASTTEAPKRQRRAA